MKFFRNTAVLGTVGLFIGVSAVSAWLTVGAAAQGRGRTVLLPKFSETAKAGKTAFDKTCAACHGKNAVGTDKGPPLLHNIYNPGHHGDAAFFNAVRRGSRQHHWRFGDMPPQPGVTDDQIAQIVRYVRELQEANGIKYRPHRM